MTFRTMQRRANEAGYSLQRGRQHYHHEGWGYVKDGNGAPVIGYQIFDYSIGLVRCGCNDLYDHSLTFEEAVDRLRILCGEKGIII